MGKRLAGKRLAVLAADGFEKTELSMPVAALETESAEVDIVSLQRGHIRGVNMHEPAGNISIDCTLADAHSRNYDGLLIPGGYISPDLLRQSAEARAFVRDFVTRGMPVAVLGHGALVLASAGLARHRVLTSWPGVRDDMVNAGATWLDEEVVRDGNLLSSRGPQDMVPFIRELIQLYCGAPASERPMRHGQSDPQRESPSTLPVAAMRLLGRKSVGAALGLALIGVGVLAATRDKSAPAAAPAPSPTGPP